MDDHPKQSPLPPTTTAEEDRTTYGQRTINLMWEGTQRIVTIMVTSVVLIVAAYLSISSTVPIELRLVAFVTLGFCMMNIQSGYFTRTNHTKIGGVGRDSVGR